MMLKKDLQLLFLAVIFCLLQFSSALFSFSNSCKKLKIDQTDALDIPECIKFRENNNEIEDHLKLLHRMYEIRNLELVLIIADQMEDGIRLARFLSKHSKKRPAVDPKALRNEELAPYRFILNYVQIFENPLFRMVFFVYPHETKNDMLAKLLVHEILKGTKNLRILLTSSIGLYHPNDSFINNAQVQFYRLLDVAVKSIQFIQNFESYLSIESSIRLLITNGTLSATQVAENKTHDIPQFKWYCKKMLRNYLVVPDITQNAKLLSMTLMWEEVIVFVNGFSETYHKLMLTNLENLRPTTLNRADFESTQYLFVECVSRFGNLGIHSVLSQVQNATMMRLLPNSSSMSTLTGVFSHFDKLHIINKTLTSFLNCTMTRDFEILSRCFSQLILRLQNSGAKNLDVLMTTINENLLRLCQIQEWYFSILSTKDIIFSPYKWTLKLRKYMVTLNKRTEWYRSLTTVYDNVHIMPEKNVTHTLQSLKESLNTVFKKYGNMKTMKIAFATVKSNVVKMKAEFKCVGVANKIKLQVRGRILSLGGILNGFRCHQKNRILEVFALEKIIIDKDLVADSDGLDVYIFAPVWEVVGNRSIVLDGLSRKLQDTYVGPKAKNGNKQTNRNGANGQAGANGGNAGTFYGLAGRVISAEGLRISVNGENGSNGQDGGDAADGEDGEFPSEAYIKMKINRHFCSWPRRHTSVFKVDGSQGFILPPKVHNKKWKYKLECYVFGLDGYPGGDGGDGGLKGKGGMAGYYKLISLDKYVQLPVVVSARNGTDGKPGHGGRAGKGGFMKKITIHNENYFDYHFTYTSDIQANDGMAGKNNSSNLGVKVEKERTILQSFAHTVNLFKRFVLSSILHYNDSKYLKLYKQVVNNKQVLKTYDILTLVEEYVDLEQHYYKTSNKTGTVYLYETWKKNLDYYSRHLKKSDQIDKNYEIMYRLQNVVSNKIKQLVQNSKSFLIFMMDEYLVESRQQVKHLQDAMTVVLIKNINSKFIEKYDDKIEEAQCIIQEELQNDLSRTNDELSGGLEQMLSSINRMIKIEETNAAELEKKSKIVIRNSVLKTFNMVFSVINIGLGIINPALGAISTAVSAAASTMIDVFAEFADTTAINVKIPNLVSKSVQFFENLIDVKKSVEESLLKKNLDYVKKEKEKMVKNGENIEPLAKVETSFEELESEMRKDNIPERDIIETINNKIETEESFWAKLNEKKSNIYAKSLEVLQKVKSFIRMNEILGELINKSTDLKDPQSINGLSSIIAKTYEKTKQLRQFKENVFKEMTPLIAKIRKNSNVSNQLKSTSVAYVDFKKFQMKKYFNNIIDAVGLFAKEFEVDSLFKKTIEKMKTVVDMILSTYSRIERYVETLKKADYQKDLFLAPFDITYSEDAKLSMALAKMVQMSAANKVLDNYNKWIGSFKQYLFPFAEEYMGTFESSIPTVDDLLVRAQDAGKRLEFYQSEMNIRRAEYRELKYTVPAQFGYNLPAFHVWNSSHFKTEISAILSGQKVKLFANITEHRNINAVKFSDIWLRFSASNQAIQDNLKQDLQGFAVKLTHAGDSYYRCDEKIFLIKSNANLFEKVYNNDDQSDHFKERIVNLKMGKKNDFILSPYASWTIEIVNVDNLRNFETFKKYKTMVDMELVGLGQYTDRNIDVCNTNLTKYYKNELSFV